MNKKQFSFIAFLLTVGLISSGYLFSPAGKESALNLIAPAQKRTLKINVHSIGELEAAKSTTLSSKLGNEQATIVYIAEDGASVQKGDLLVKIDSNTYEKRVEELSSKIKEQQSIFENCIQSVNREVAQKEVDKHMAQSELFLAELEYDKVVNKEGPLEEKKLKGAIDKCLGKIISLEKYHKDLEELASEGYRNEPEIKQTLYKIQEEEAALETAKEQYLCFTETTFPMEKHKAEASLKKARIQANEAEEKSQCKIFKAESNLAQAKNHLEELKIALHQAKQDLNHTELTAPTDGMVVIKEEFRAGQRRKTKIGDSVTKNQPILELPDLSQMSVRTRIREIDLHKIQVGKEAIIEVDAFPELSFQGTVTNIGVLALKDPFSFAEEKFFDVQIALNETHPSLRPGMTVRVSTHSQNIDNALTIPYQSLFEAEDQSKYCYVISRGRCLKREIKIAAIDEQWIVVESGLKEGEKVCLTQPQQEIKL